MTSIPTIQYIDATQLGDILVQELAGQHQPRRERRAADVRAKAVGTA